MARFRRFKRFKRFRFMFIVFLTAKEKKAFESDYWPPKTLRVGRWRWSKHKFYPDTMTHEK